MLSRLVESTFNRFEPLKSTSKQDLIKIKLQGMGSLATGFVEDQWGPFHCGNCSWFGSREGKTICSHPAIRRDKNIKSRLKDSTPIVSPNDCSNKFWTKGVSVQEYLSGQRLNKENQNNGRSLDHEVG